MKLTAVCPPKDRRTEVVRYLNDNCCRNKSFKKLFGNACVSNKATKSGNKNENNKSGLDNLPIATFYNNEYTLEVSSNYFYQEVIL